MRGNKIIVALMVATLLFGILPSKITNAKINTSKIIGSTEYNDKTEITLPQYGDFDNELALKDSGFGPSKYILTGIYKKYGEEVTITISDHDQIVRPEMGFTSATLSSYQEAIIYTFPLNPGTVTIDKRAEGIIYFVNESDPTSKPPVVTINGGIRMPHFELESNHTLEDWNYMLETYKNSPGIELVGRNSMISISMDQAQNIKNPIELLKTYDTVVDISNKTSGLDINDSNPIHRPYQYKYHYREHTMSDYYMYAWFNHTGYATHTLAEVLDYTLINSDKWWGVFHETGHVYQPKAWTSSDLVEVNVNLYSLRAQKYFGQTSRLEAEGYYPKISKYLNSSSKNYETEADLFIKVGMLWQLELAYGDDFYPNLNRYYRELIQTSNPTNDIEKRQLFAIVASKISNTNLVPFFEMWGYKLTDDTKSKMSTYSPLNKEIWKLTDSNRDEIMADGNYKNWDKSQVYTSGELVSYKGFDYKARSWTQNNQPDLSAEWEFIGPGTQIWNEQASYIKDEIVLYNGKKYVSKYWTKNSKPDLLEAWTLLN